MSNGFPPIGIVYHPDGAITASNIDEHGIATDFSDCKNEAILSVAELVIDKHNGQAEFTIGNSTFEITARKLQEQTR